MPQTKLLMSKDTLLQKKWEAIVSDLSEKFSDGDPLSMDSIIYLIGVQELGKGPQDFTKDDKINLMHVAICKLLEPYDYYKFSHTDSDNWPHYTVLKKLPVLKPEQQSELMKKAIIRYFE